MFVAVALDDAVADIGGVAEAADVGHPADENQGLARRRRRSVAVSGLVPVAARRLKSGHCFDRLILQVAS